MVSEQFMTMALEEACLAAEHGDVPVGAVVVVNGEVVARRHNERELTGDPTAHAEMLAIRDAASATGSWRLNDAELYVTLEPCPMCAGAIVNARIGSLCFATADPKAGATGSLYNLCQDPRLNHEVGISRGLLGDEAAAQLKQFFIARRS